MSMPRPDLSHLQALNDLAGSLRPEGLSQQLQERARAVRQIQDKVRELVGRAESDDGYIAASYTADAGLDSLTLDPRAMRMASADLAAEIVEVGRQARADYERQRDELADELGARPVLDVEEAERTIGEINDAATRGISDMQSMVERFSRQMGG